MNNEAVYDRQRIVRRSKLYIPVNRDKFVDKAWTRNADVIILDLEDSIPYQQKDAARKKVETAVPIVMRGGAEVQVRINRTCQDEDLDAVVGPNLSCIMIPKCETAEEIQEIDAYVRRLEGERNIPCGAIQFDLIIETARGIVNVEKIATASPRIAQMTTGQGDLAVDIGFTRYKELNMDQYLYAESRLLYSAVAAGVQPHGMWAQNNVDFTDNTLAPEAMTGACQHAFWMGFMGTSVIHPKWVQAANEGFTPPEHEIELARRVKQRLEEAYAAGKGSVSVDGRMYDVANMKQIDKLLFRADAIQKRDSEKAAAVEQGRAGG